jgi:hypothetical protein
LNSSATLRRGHGYRLLPGSLLTGSLLTGGLLTTHQLPTYWLRDTCALLHHLNRLLLLLLELLLLRLSFRC